MRIKNILRIFASGAAFLLCACQHDIEPDELDFVPEVDEIGVTSSTVSAEEADRILLELESQPYPPYTIQGGDRFRVRVYNEDDMNNNSTASTLITPDGYLIMDMIEPVLIKDLTIIEATRKVREALGKFIRYPHVSIQPDQTQGEAATLLGAVNEPGRYTVSSNTRLADLIAMGKGTQIGWLDNNSVDLADLNNAYVLRDGKILPASFYEALINGNQKHNIRIFPGDLVFVPKKEGSRVYVMGEVKWPRWINWNAGMTFMDAIADANGLTEEHWDVGLILRKPSNASEGALQVFKLDINDVIAGRQKNFKLASGDIVYIPKDCISEYNVFIRKLLPTVQLINQLSMPISTWAGGRR